MKSLTFFKIAVLILIIGGIITKYYMDVFVYSYIIASIVFLIGMYKNRKL